MNEENEAKEDSPKKETFVCDDCGKVIDPSVDTYYETHDGRIICESCYDYRYFTCDDCGEVYPNDDLTTVGNRSYCESCRDSNCVRCRDCEEWVENEDAISVGWGECICDDCYRYQYFTCDRCDEVFHNDDGQWVGNDHCCESCARQVRIESGVHDYHDSDIEYNPVESNGESVPMDEPYIGVELECDGGDFDVSDFREWINKNDLIHFEHDGSLSDYGVELITQPCTLLFHQKDMDWEKLCKRLIGQEFKSHDTTCCGLHVHMSRYRIPITSIVKMDIWLNRWLLWKDVARRKSIYNGEYDESKRMDIGHAIYNNYKMRDVYSKWYGRGNNERYQPLNTNNMDTIEIRIFRGTLNHETVLGTIEMCHALVKFANVVQVVKTYDATPEQFLAFVAENVRRYPHVFPMLKRLIKDDEPAGVKGIVEKVNEKIEKEVKKCA